MGLSNVLELAFTSLQEPILCISSQCHVQRCHVGSLKLTHDGSIYLQYSNWQILYIRALLLFFSFLKIFWKSVHKHTTEASSSSTFPQIFVCYSHPLYHLNFRAFLLKIRYWLHIQGHLIWKKLTSFNLWHSIFPFWSKIYKSMVTSLVIVICLND